MLVHDSTCQCCGRRGDCHYSINPVRLLCRDCHVGIVGREPVPPPTYLRGVS